MRNEKLARLVFLLIVIGLPAAAILYVSLPHPAQFRTIEIQASVPEAGGFAPASISVQAGETITLRFTSTDVTHGVAIGPGLGIDLGQIEPGLSKEATITFDQAGTYTFYCTTWCSTDHWRMRGVIDVQSDSQVLPLAVSDAVITALVAEGVDIDAGFFSRGAAAHLDLDLSAISPARGLALLPRISTPDELLEGDWRQTHTPAEAVAMLQIANPELTEKDLVDVVAHLWLSDQVALPAIGSYNQNCAACHGQFGNGDGPAAVALLNPPAAFADPAYMFHMRADVLYAKIRRGGMGSDMPNFGTIFTPQETWALVDYLWLLSFDPPE